MVKFLLSPFKFILLISMLAILALHAAAQTDSVTKAGQLIKLEQAMMDAMPGDTVLWVKHLDPKWYIVTEDGTGMNKKTFLAGFSPFPKEVSGNINVRDPHLAFHGDIAVIHYVADEHEKFYGQMLHTTYATVDTWYKTDTSWMMLSSQIFEIPQVPPAIKLNASILRQYTGSYVLVPGKTALITLKNDTLFIQKNKGRAEALLPETSNVFFRLTDARGRKLFVKDGAGQMLMMERRNGQDIIWKRSN